MTGSTKVILFNHGGGLRGVIPARIMTHIEARTGLRMSDMVDVFCGPSTGSILNAAMNVPHKDDALRPQYRARHLVRFYEREGANIFESDRFRMIRGLLHDFNDRTTRFDSLDRYVSRGHYNPDHLAYCLRQLYGDFRLRDSLKSLVIPFYSIDRTHLEEDQTGDSIWVSHFKDDFCRDSLLPRTPDVSMYDAVLASTAAPTYFPSHHFMADLKDGFGKQHITAIDGSIFDSPSMSYFGALQPHISDDDHVIVIVLGTGYVQKPITKAEWDRFGSLGVVDPQNGLPLINIFFHAPESALQHRLQERCEENGEYFYFNKGLTAGSEGAQPSDRLDDARPENFSAMKNFTLELLEEREKELDRLCDVLVRAYESKQEHEKKRRLDTRRFWGIFKLGD